MPFSRFSLHDIFRFSSFSLHYIFSHFRFSFIFFISFIFIFSFDFLLLLLSFLLHYRYFHMMIEFSFLSFNISPLIFFFFLLISRRLSQLSYLIIDREYFPLLNSFLSTAFIYSFIYWYSRLTYFHTIAFIDIAPFLHFQPYPLAEDVL
jgi:hypothetical protein